jgi:hypothetical protein
MTPELGWWIEAYFTTTMDGFKTTSNYAEQENARFKRLAWARRFAARGGRRPPPPRGREHATLGHHCRAITEAMTEAALRTHPPPSPRHSTTHIIIIYDLNYIESVGVGRRATYLSGGGLCAGLCYVTLYALVIHLIGTQIVSQTENCTLL